MQQSNYLRFTPSGFKDIAVKNFGVKGGCLVFLLSIIFKVKNYILEKV